jgi:hypothetical protein
MTRRRGRPVRPIPVHPERVISRAVKAGLSATIVLQRAISNKSTMKYYDRSYKRWSVRQEVFQATKERGTPDFSHISKAEASIRDDTRLMLYERAAKYGFTEVSRQKNADDTVDSLNQRFNACGAVVRENSEIMFPMPNPTSFGTYTRRDGKGRKKFRREGYEGSSFGPKVILSHPDLPSLDFGDAVRSHNEYLATFCAIHDVPVKETTRYSHLFFLLVRPYLEYLYSESKIGKANFQKGVNWALRQIKELILEAGYRPTMYRKRTVTKELGFEESKNKEENKTFFKRCEGEAREFYGDHAAVAELSRLRGKLGDDEDTIAETNESSEEDTKEDDDAIFTEKDVDFIRNKVAKRARIAGSIMHRRVSDLFPSPWHLNGVILSGDRYARSSDYIINAEVPLQTPHGAGKIDLILCERTISNDGKRVFWKPVFILEIKTRLGQSWYVDANYKESEVRPEDSSLQRVVSDFPLSDYLLSDELWDAIVKSTPTPAARKQLDIYSLALSELYESATQEKLGHVLKGVIVIEAASDIIEIRQVLERLIVHAYESVKSRTRRFKRTLFTPTESDFSRIVLVLDEQPGLGRKDGIKIQAPWSPIYTPFKIKKKARRKFMLYLAGHAPTSAGQSAAWNARYYHGLQFLHEIIRTQGNAEFVWIDLASQFNRPRLAEARLRLRPRGYSEDEIAKVQPGHIREFFESIKVRGYLDEVLSFLYKDGDIPSFELKTGKNKKKVIVVTGADTLRDATPTFHREQLVILIEHLLSSLPDDEETTIVWFDAPLPAVEKSIPYSSRALVPYYETSPLGEVVTDIIWNLPVTPRGAVQPEKWGLPIIGDSPMHDDIRVVIRHSPTEFQMELTHVPFLRGWSKRFRNKGTGRIIRGREIDDIVPEKTVRNRMKLLSLTMLPWLVRLWPNKTLVEDSIETLEEQFSHLEKEFRGETEPLDILKAVLPEPPCNPPSLLDLVKFRLPATMDALSYQMMTAGKINSQRLYRSPRKLQTQPLQVVPHSPLTQEVPTIDEVTPKQEWLFGIKFEDNNNDILSWWIAVQNPVHLSRILIGCFCDRPPDKDGFLWAESRHEILTQSGLDEILACSQTLLIGRKTEKGLELWTSNDGDEPVYAGILEVKGQGRSTIGHLRAIKQTFTEEPGMKPSSTTRPSESFYKRMVDCLRRHIVTATSPTPVRVHLEMADHVCRVTLKDEEGEIIQDTTIEYTADLISFLRWPIVKGGPMFTDSGVYVMWSIFDDIDYGELDFISPYVTYTASRTTPAELPKRVSQFFDEAESLSVSISHDTSVCPLALGKGVDHGSCWRIELPHNCPAHVRKQLGTAMTGEAVNGLLAPGRLYLGRLYTFDLILPPVSEHDESIVFHEDRYIRMFLRRYGQHLKRLPPGTFLHVINQQWMVSIGWDGRHFKWQAQSTISGLYFRGNHQTVELVHGHGAQDECERLMTVITSQIPPARIVEYTDLREQVLAGLKDRGYSKSSPACEFSIIEQSECIFRYGLFLREGDQRDPFLVYTIESTGGVDPDTILEEITMGLEEGELSVYNIKNAESFLKRLSSWVNEHISVIEEHSEEPEEYEVTLSIGDKGDAIIWKAEVYGTEKSTTGVLYDDLKVLLHAGTREAIREVREIFEIDVVTQVGVIANLEEVMKQQIPDMIRSIREESK